MSKILIGIDPDVDKSGVAYIGIDCVLILDNLTFFKLYDFLSYVKNLSEKGKIIATPLKVYIEAGWLNKTNWHTSSKMNIATVAQIGARTGANHETGRKIAEMCEYLKINYELVRPTQSKVDAVYFKQLTKYQGRTNQEQRDAAMLIWGM